MMDKVTGYIETQPVDQEARTPVVSGTARMYVQNALEVTLLGQPVHAMVVIDAGDYQYYLDLMPDGTYRVHNPGKPGHQWDSSIEIGRK
mgnify:CR=1 FL=1